MSLRSPTDDEKSPYGTGGSQSVIPAKAGIHDYTPPPRLDIGFAAMTDPGQLSTDPKTYFQRRIPTCFQSSIISLRPGGGCQARS